MFLQIKYTKSLRKILKDWKQIFKREDMKNTIMLIFVAQVCNLKDQNFAENCFLFKRNTNVTPC